MIENVRSIIVFTFREHFRNRIYLSLILFGFILLVGGLVISALAMEQRGRMMLNLGFTAIEFMGLMTVVFVTVNLILAEIDTRTIYLILSRPVPRWQYILSRFAGTWLAIVLSMAIMAGVHVLLLLPYAGVISAQAYALAWVCAILKLALVGSLALALSLFSTSAPTAMTFTMFLWALGHFSQEIRFLGQKSSYTAVQALAELTYHITPNFSYFNYRDFFYAAQPPGMDWAVALLVYAVSYTGICLWVSSVLFSRREF